METSPVTCRTLEEFYHIDGHTFEKQYKESLSGYRDWEQLEHADEWLLFADNIGPRLAIDESSLSNGELYTFVTNRDARTRERSLVAVVAGTKSEDVIAVLLRIDGDKRNEVTEVTLDLSDSMHKIVRTVFPKASRVIDRFHIQKLACDAVQELRIRHRWNAIQQANDEMEEAKLCDKPYKPYRYANGDTGKELLAPAGNCSSGRVTCCSSLPINGLTGRNNGPEYCLRNIRTYRRHTDSAIPCG